MLNAQLDDPRALADLCKSYWFPLYFYARRLRNSPEDAEDLTQAFFQRLLSKDGLRRAREANGKLRSFLLRSLENFAIDEWRKSQSKRRGGGETLIEIDSLDAEARFALEPKNGLTPALEFDRVWARQLLQEVMNRLQSAYEVAGKGKSSRNCNTDWRRMATTGLTRKSRARLALVNPSLGLQPSSCANATRSCSAKRLPKRYPPTRRWKKNCTT